MSLLQWLTLIPVVVGSIFSCLCVLTFGRFCALRDMELSAEQSLPPVTILKPVCGLEKGLEQSLRSACLQDYPCFQVVCSVRSVSDTALPLLKRIEREFPGRAVVVIDGSRPGPNRKVANLGGALARARSDIIVISDSDIYLGPDYLRRITAPLSDPRVGYVCTLYRAVAAERWYEKLEALTLNADFIPGVVFAYMTRASRFCLGASVAFRRSDLAAGGGIEVLGNFLAEDYELGRRLSESGRRMVLVPETVDVVVDLKSPAEWWKHQVSWDQKTRAACPSGFAASILNRAVPFAALFAVIRGGDGIAPAVFGAALAVRWLTAAFVIRRGLRDRESLLPKMILLPFRDAAALVSWAAALVKKKVVWRGAVYQVTPGGRIAERESHE
jgi:ceramide glucosyltransferase